MDRSTLVKTTRRLMHEHGLTDWKVEVMHSKHTAGRCSYGARTIEMSLPCAEARSEAETINTILHEIAHALTPGHKHDWVWRAKLLELGGDGRTRWNNEDARKQMALWVGVCPSGHESYRNARSAKMTQVSCGKCSRRFDARFALTWTNRKTGEVVRPARVAAAPAVPDFSGAGFLARLQSVAEAPVQVPTPAAPAQLCKRCFTIKSSSGACNCF